ncbi:hypothetical protein [Runella sp.]|uniref:hypothetical protein n=1 Tax=Runella sp. TaxID=1960881 RepID=UPI003D0C4548
MKKTATGNDMKKIHLLFTLLIPFIQSCATGEKALKKGKYEQALSLSINRLKRHPAHENAKNVFLAAYKGAEQSNKENIERYLTENRPFKWESVLYEYQQLQKKERALKNCRACLQLLDLQPISYDDVIEQVTNLAATERYEAGLTALQYKENRPAAQDAVTHFLKVKQLSQKYTDADSKLLLAKEYATLRIVIEPVIEEETMSKHEYDYLQKQLEEEFFENRTPHELILFQNPAAAQEDSLPAHHVLRLYFTGQSGLRELIGSTDATLESNIKYKVGTKKINDTTIVDVMEPVKGTLTTHYRKRSKSNELKYEIINLENDCVIHQDWFRGNEEWKEEWQTFSGDNRALNGTVLTSSQTLFPASDWDLFKKLSRSAAGRIYYRIQNFYRKPLTDYSCLPKTSR